MSIIDNFNMSILKGGSVTGKGEGKKLSLPRITTNKP